MGNSKSSGKILLSIIAGVAVGALLGVLFAPDSGWNTRKRIEKTGEDYADSILENLNAFIYDLTENSDEVTDEVIDEEPGFHAHVAYGPIDVNKNMARATGW